MDPIERHSSLFKLHVLLALKIEKTSYENHERCSIETYHGKKKLPEFASIGMNNSLKSRLDMKDNSKCITISLSTSTWSHCFVDFEVNLGSVEVGYERYQ